MAGGSAGTAMSAQFNVRMDRRLKAAGDRALASASISPSRAVRSLWGRLAACADDPAAVRLIVDPVPSAGHGEAAADPTWTAAGHELALKGPALALSALEGMGISGDGLPADAADAMDDRELLESELLDALSERGLGE